VNISLPTLAENFGLTLILPKSQGFLTYQLGTLGYQVTPHGLCCGLSQMLMQAFLANDLPRYYRRLARLYYITEVYGTLVNYVEHIQEERHASKRFKASIDAELTDFFAFLDGVTLYQNPSYYGSLFKDQSLVQCGYPAKSLLVPATLEEKNQYILQTPLRTVSYNPDSFESYLKDLKEQLGAVAFSVQLGANLHQTSLHYNPNLKEWLFFDPNKLDHLEFLDNSALLVQHIFNAYQTYDNISFTISIHALSSHEILFQQLTLNSDQDLILKDYPHLSLEFISQLAEDLIVACNARDHLGSKRIIHCLKHQVNLTSTVKNKLLGALKQAAANNEIEIVKMLIENNFFTEDIDRSLLNLALGWALSDGSLKTAQYLLEKYPWLLTHNSENDLSCLMWAAANFESLKLVLSYYKKDKCAEITALRIVRTSGYNVLFYAVRNADNFSIFLQKFLEDSVLRHKLQEVLYLIMVMNWSIEYPESLEKLFQASLRFPLMKAALITAIYDDQPVKDSIFKQAFFSYPLSLKVILNFLPENITLALVCELINHPLKWLSQRIQSVPDQPLNAEMNFWRGKTNELLIYLADSHAVNQVSLGYYALHHHYSALRVLFDHLTPHGQARLLESGIRRGPRFVHEAAKLPLALKIIQRRVLLQNKAQGKSLGLSPSSTRILLKNKQNKTLPFSFVRAFEKALESTKKFKGLLSSFSDQELMDRLNKPLGDGSTLFSRSLYSPPCFRYLHDRLHQHTHFISTYSMLACLRHPHTTQTLLDSVGSKKVFELVFSLSLGEEIILILLSSWITHLSPAEFQSLWQKIDEINRLKIISHCSENHSILDLIIICERTQYLIIMLAGIPHGAQLPIIHSSPKLIELIGKRAELRLEIFNLLSEIDRLRLLLAPVGNYLFWYIACANSLAELLKIAPLLSLSGRALLFESPCHSDGTGYSIIQFYAKNLGVEFNIFCELLLTLPAHIRLRLIIKSCLPDTAPCPILRLNAQNKARLANLLGVLPQEGLLDVLLNRDENGNTVLMACMTEPLILMIESYMTTHAKINTIYNWPIFFTIMSHLPEPDRKCALLTVDQEQWSLICRILFDEFNMPNSLFKAILELLPRDDRIPLMFESRGNNNQPLIFFLIRNPRLFAVAQGLVDEKKLATSIKAIPQLYQESQDFHAPQKKPTSQLASFSLFAMASAFEHLQALSLPRPL